MSEESFFTSKHLHKQMTRKQNKKIYQPQNTKKTMTQKHQLIYLTTSYQRKNNNKLSKQPSCTELALINIIAV